MGGGEGGEGEGEGGDALWDCELLVALRYLLLTSSMRGLQDRGGGRGGLTGSRWLCAFGMFSSVSTPS